MSHWEITWSMIGHKFIMVLEEVLSRNALTHRRVEFLRCSSPDVTSIVHHLGFALIWKEHFPDLLMSALQLNLLYILCLAAVSQMFSCCFMTILCKTNTNTEWHEAAIFFITGESITAHAEGHSLHLCARAAFQLWRQGKITFLLLFKLLTTVFYVYLLLISELHAWINNAPKQLKYNQLEITICSHGDWNFVLKRLWKKKGIWIKIVLSAHFCQQNPDTYISNHRIRADK